MYEKQIQDFISSAREVLRTQGYFVQKLWHVDDVHLLCEQRGWPQLTHEDGLSVFAIFNELFDGGEGLTWERLEQATQIYLAQQGHLKQILENEEDQLQQL